jgi:hypothetical protein
MQDDAASRLPSRPGLPTFETIADGIMYRWTAERDTWVSTIEVQQARAYLERLGIPTRPLEDGRFRIEGRGIETVGAAHVVLLGLRHLHARRRGPS